MEIVSLFVFFFQWLLLLPSLNSDVVFVVAVSSIVNNVVLVVIVIAIVIALRCFWSRTRDSISHFSVHPSVGRSVGPSVRNKVNF